LEEDRSETPSTSFNQAEGLLEIELDEHGGARALRAAARSASAGEWRSVVGVFAAIAAVALVLLIVMYWRAAALWHRI
jgi:hypothetical protein